MLDRRIVGQEEKGQDIDATGQAVERFRSPLLPLYLRNPRDRARPEVVPRLPRTTAGLPRPAPWSRISRCKLSNSGEADNLKPLFPAPQ